MNVDYERYQRYEQAALDALARHGGIARTGELMLEGVRPEALMRLWHAGKLLRLKAGLWQRIEDLPDEHADLVQAAHAVPHGVICLLSALDFHGLTDAAPERVFVAIAQGSWAPRTHEAAVEYVRFRPPYFELGQQEHIGGR